MAETVHQVQVFKTIGRKSGGAVKWQRKCRIARLQV